MSVTSSMAHYLVRRSILPEKLHKFMQITRSAPASKLYGAMHHNILYFAFITSTMVFVATHNFSCAAEFQHKENCMFPTNEQFANAARNIFPANEQYTNAMKNLFPDNEQFANAARTNLATQLAIMTTLATKVFESTEKVMDLNLNAVKASLEDSAGTANQLLSAKDPQEFLSLTVAQAQPMAVKTIAYSRQFAGIAAAAQAEFTRGKEEQIAETGRKLSALVDEAFKGAPTGSGHAIAIIMKSAIGNTNVGYEQFNKTTKQAVEAMESNMNRAVNQLSQSAERTANTTTGRARR
jgi:phasin family protein